MYSEKEKGGGGGGGSRKAHCLPMSEQGMGELLFPQLIGFHVPLRAALRPSVSTGVDGDF